MTRCGRLAHPLGVSPTDPASGSGRRFRGLALGLAAALLLGAAEPMAPRPAGTSHAEAVALALELALVAPRDGSLPLAGLEEARALLGLPNLAPEDLRAAALETGSRWAGRADPARRLWLEWPILGDPVGRQGLLERPDPEGSLGRLAIVAAFCDSLIGSRHLPVGQAEALIALTAAQRDAEAALVLAGEAIENLALRTDTAQRQVGAWREVLAVARLPGPLPWEPRIAARGQPLDEPMAMLVRVEEPRVLLGTRSLLSWRDGALVRDAGPAPEVLDRGSSEVWERWRVIARRRGAVALAGVTALPSQGSAAEALAPEPLLVAEPDLPLARLAEVLGWLAAEGEPRACLLVRDPGEGNLQRACFAVGPEPDGQTWLHPTPGATVQDLARALDEGAVGVVVP